MKELRIKCIVLGIIILFCIGTLMPLILSENNPIETDIQEEPLLQINDNPINIILPENKTYTEPMSGHYPATYGFENVPDGNDDPDWVDGPGSSKIIVSLGDHNKVYQCASGVLGLNQYFVSEQSNGTVEFYMNAQNANNGFQFRFFRDTDMAVNFRIYGDNFQNNNGSGFFNMGKSASDNTWYHIRVDFETTEGGYMGLLQWTYRVFIDSEEFGPYKFIGNYTPNKVHFYSVSYSTARSIDAVGYSWEPSYNIGDNKYEGLLLIFTTEIGTEWIAYSLDGQNNVTILGIKTIPMPTKGTHRIKIFINDSVGGGFHESENRYFTISSVSRIPGYNIFLLISMICVVSVIFLERRYKFLK